MTRSKSPAESPRNNRAGYTRQRQGCLTCRRRKKKCDRTYPVCGHCLRLNFTCEREAPRTLPESTSVEQQEGRHLGSASAGSIINNKPDHVARLYHSLDQSVLQDEVCSGDVLASRRAMLRYYTSVFATLLSTNQENNCFLTVLLPMAFECSALMKALVAWASTHLALRDKSYQDISLRHRGSALTNFNLSMEENEISPEMCLAVAMVFCSMESISDRTGSWYHHLIGGAAALGATPNETTTLQSTSRYSRMTSFEGKWLLRNFAYHDVLMSVSRNCRPLISGDYWSDDDNSRKADPYFGLGARIISLISQISHLNADLAAVERGTFDQEKCLVRLSVQTISESQLLLQSHPYEAPTYTDFSPRAHAIENQLIAWECPEEYSGSTLDKLAESYRRAALLHLYRTLRRYFPDLSHVLQEKIRQNVDFICSTVREMPDGCLAECTLLFPLFMAGGEAEDHSQIETIRGKMRSINQWRHFRYVEQCLEVLDELWRLRMSGSKGTNNAKLDWLDIVENHNLKLAIT